MNFSFNEAFLLSNEVFVILLPSVEVSGLTHLLPPEEVYLENVVLSKGEVLNVLFLEGIEVNLELPEELFVVMIEVDEVHGDLK